MSTFRFPPVVDALLTQLAADEGVTKSEILRRALAVYTTMWEEKKKGHKIYVADVDDKLIKLLLMQ